MAYLGSWKIDDWLTFYCNTHRADTGAATDGDGVPTYRVYEDETGAAIANGSMAKLDDANTTGFYSERVQLTSGIGYEKGKQYTIYVSVTVNSVVGTIHHTLQIEAEVDANTISASLNDPTAATIADAVWDENIEGAHGGDTTAGLLLRVLGSAISDRANNATLNALLGVTDAAGDDLPEQVWAEAVRVLTANTNLNDPTAATIADAVWDEDIEAAHGTDATAGLLLRALGQNISNETHDANLLDQIRRTIMVIESQRGMHTHQPIGNIFFIDPVGGDTHANGNRGGISDPYDSVQDCHDNAITDNNHDMIILLAGAAAGATTLTEAVTLSKRYMFIRGPGRGFIWTRGGNGNTISITANGIELTGFQLNTAGTGSGHGIQITDADFMRVHKLWVNATRGDGINILRGENCQIHNNTFTDTGQSGAGQGIDILGTAGSSNFNVICDNIFRDCAGDAIKISGGTTNNTTIARNYIEGSSGWGIDIGASSVDAVVVDNRLGNNTSGNINDGGTTTTLLNNEQWSVAGDMMGLANDAITAAKIAVDAIGASEIADGAIDAATFAAGAIDASAIAADAIGASEIADGAIDSGAIATGAIDADALAADAITEIRSLVSGTADSGTVSTMVDAARTEADADYWKGCWILFTSGNIANQVRLITGFTVATDTITFSPNTTQAVSTHTYEILPAGAVDVRLWLGTVMNALTSGRVDASVGAMAANVLTASAIASNAIDADAIAANAIGASEIAADAITSSEFATSAANEIRDAILDDATRFSGADVATILADTNELQTDWANGGRLDLLIDAIKAVTDNLPDSGALTTLVNNVAAILADTGTDGVVLANDAITAAKIAANAIGASELADAAIDAATFAAGAINAAAIANDAITAAKIATDAIAADAIAADAITSSELATSAAQEIADEVLKRGVSNVEDAADTTSLAAIVLATLESSVAGVTWTIRKTGGAVFVTKTITADASADPITGVT